ncbi:MAG: molybdopterin dinucleotide binding domain-containing protein [Solirubrobacteraceae bacterium]
MFKVRRARHGIALGPLQPHLISILRTDGRRIRLAPAMMMAEAGELEGLAGERAASVTDGHDLVLIARRLLRSINSWMHNSRRLMKGADRCKTLLHPDDAGARGLQDGQRVRLISAVGAIKVALQISDEMRPGVVSIPPGFGHTREGVGWMVAAAHGGASVNDVTDPSAVDRLTGSAALNAVMIRLEAVNALERSTQRIPAEMGTSP